MYAAATAQPARRPAWKRWVRLTAWTTLGGVLAVGLINGLVWGVGRSHVRTAGEVAPAQVVIVLGAYVFPDGHVSDMVADRLETAYALYEAGKAKKILISGDHGRTNYDEVNTMRHYLESKGVPTEDIFMDHAGFDTYNSMYRADAVFQVGAAIVVTQGFHLPRALYIARRLGLNAEGVVADRHLYVSAAYYELREVIARLKAFGEVLVHRQPTFLGPVIPITGSGAATHDQPQ